MAENQRLSWQDALEQMARFNENHHPFWLLTNAAEQRLMQALTEEKKREASR